MALSARRMRDFIKLDLGPALAAAHDAEAARYVVGAGFHWYDTMSWSWAGWAGIDWRRGW